MKTKWKGLTKCISFYAYWINQTAVKMWNSLSESWTSTNVRTVLNTLEKTESYDTNTMPNIEYYEDHFKTKRVKDRAHLLHPIIKEIMVNSIEWFRDYGVSLIITETVTTEEEDKKLNRVSSTHRQGRAFDFRTRDLDHDLIEDYIIDFTNSYGAFGAISPKDFKPRLFVWHNSGHGDHVHVQISAKYAVNYNLET